jgi:hypothetical protein
MLIEGTRNVQVKLNDINVHHDHFRKNAKNKKNLYQNK